jgi:hypothetical protein
MGVLGIQYGPTAGVFRLESGQINDRNNGVLYVNARAYHLARWKWWLEVGQQEEREELKKLYRPGRMKEWA